jgi:hypothetical protein
MRKSHTRTGLRPIKAGVAAAATAAAVVAGTTTAVIAAVTNPTLTPSTSTVPVAGGWDLTFRHDDLSAFTAPLPDEAWFLQGASCPAAASRPTAESDTTKEVTLDAGSLGAQLAADYVTVTTPALSAGTWRFCMYESSAPAQAGNATVSAVAFGKMSAYYGSSAGGNILTFTVPTATFIGGVATTFNSATTTCPATYGTANTTTNIAAASSKKSTTEVAVTVPKTLTVADDYGVCIYTGTGTGTLLARGDMTYAGYDPTLPTVTVNPTGGAEGLGNVTLTTTTANTFSVVPGISFTRGSCPGTLADEDSVVDPYSVDATLISGTKVAVPIPATTTVNGSDATTPWHICVFASDDDNAKLLTQPVTYSVAPVLSLADITDADFSLASGPAQGGTYVTIVDLQGIPTAAGAAVSATLGGSPLTELKINNSESISGYTTAHAPGEVALSVTTAAGTQTSPTTPFEYSYGITVEPNTAEPGDAEVVLDVMGAGFTDPDIDWPTTDFSASAVDVSVDTDARVLLTNNAWNNQVQLTNADGTGINAFATADGLPTTQCGEVLVISDSELICTMDLSVTLDISTNNVTTTATPVDPGTYTVTVINTNGAAGASSGVEFGMYNVSVPSSGSTFTVADF